MSLADLPYFRFSFKHICSHVSLIFNVIKLMKRISYSKPHQTRSKSQEVFNMIKDACHNVHSRWQTRGWCHFSSVNEILSVYQVAFVLVYIWQRSDRWKAGVSKQIKWQQDTLRGRTCFGMGSSRVHVKPLFLKCFWDWQILLLIKWFKEYAEWKTSFLANCSKG